MTAERAMFPADSCFGIEPIAAPKNTAARTFRPLPLPTEIRKSRFGFAQTVRRDDVARFAIHGYADYPDRSALTRTGIDALHGFEVNVRVPVKGEPSDMVTVTTAIAVPAGELSGTAGIGLGVTVIIGTGPTTIGASVSVVLMLPCVAVRASV